MSKKEFEYLWTDKKRTIFGLPLSFTRYYITENKLITRHGFLTINEDEIDIYKITDKSLKMSLGQRIFGTGSIIVRARDIDTPEKIIQSIKNPRKVSALLDKQIQIARDKYSIRGRDMYGRAGDDGTDNTPDNFIDSDMQ